MVKETIRRYEDAQGLQYHEKPVHLDRAIVGLILATFVHHQRKLCAAEDARQAAQDREVDAQVQRMEAENEVAQLKRDLFKSQDAVHEAQEIARRHEKAYHETLVLLKRAQTGDSAATNQADRVYIQSLKAQLNKANQQLRQLRAERAPNAADCQMALPQSQTNEQLEALHTENAVAHKAITQVAAERDSTRKAYVQLQMQTLKESAKLDAESTTLGVRCLQAEAEVIELKEKVGILEWRGGYRANAGQAQGPGRAMDTEGAGQAPQASTVTTGAYSTTTNQGPGQAGSHPSPQLV